MSECRKCRLKGFRRHFLHNSHRFPSLPMHRNPETRHSRAGGNLDIQC
ncbi:hypothetical protein [Neisseria meningitidis]|nr:hypothetical protein [Neisseria meningitidis]MBW3872585.1 hypothetical protein [Neisseria meningitidis]